MTTRLQQATSGLPNAPHALADSTCWIITDGKAGMDVQARGVADALGAPYQIKHVAPRGMWAALAPWGPVAPSERFGQPGTPFGQPWPDIAIATGRASIPYLRALRKRAGAKLYAVILQDPKTNAKSADLIWVPAHDRRRGANVITTLTSPHSFSAQRLAHLRATLPDSLAALTAPRIAVILGGKNGVYRFSDADDDRLAGALSSLKELGCSFMITPSRRTHRRLLRAVETATAGAPRTLWDGNGENPYPSYLAHADALIVTADSVNMCGEACATGRPVLVFTPSGGSPKFTRFHEGLAQAGATRPLPDQFSALPHWEYAPLDSAAIIADEIRARWRTQSTPLS